MTRRTEGIEQAKMLVEDRVALLRAKYKRDAALTPRPSTLASDMAAILEAELIIELLSIQMRQPSRRRSYDDVRKLRGKDLGSE